MAKDVLTAEEKEELRLRNSDAANQRQAYRRCLTLLTATAGSLFVEGKDDIAYVVRKLADEVRMWYDEQSEIQDECLKKLGYK